MTQYKPTYRTVCNGKAYDFETLKEADAKMTELISNDDDEFADAYVEEVWPYASIIVHIGF